MSNSILFLTVSRGAWKGTNRSKIYEELGWEALSDRRKVQRLIQLYKIINYRTPSYLRDKLPPQSHPFDETSFTLREYRTRTDRFAMTFFPDTIKQWNVVITDFSEMPDLITFKNHLLYYRFSIAPSQNLSLVFMIPLA